MKIGIVTLHAAHNYGAVLQAYGTQQVLTNLGYDSCIINYKTNRQAENYALFKSSKNLKSIYSNGLVLMHYSQLKRRWEKFEQFISNYLVLSGKRYSSFESLKEEPPNMDAFICGSDQIWNPNATLSPVWFLAFTDEAKRIAYAPSFGVNEIPHEQHEIFRGFLDGIPYLSVREERGAEIIEELTGRKAEIVLDPTMLLKESDWGGLVESNGSGESYILVYCLEPTPQFNDMVTIIKKKTGLQVKVIGNKEINQIKSADRVLRDVGPIDYLSLFKNASVICTNSFHGTVFSIIFRKPFWGVPHTRLNSRMVTLLKKLNLSSRQIQSISDISNDPLYINYAEVEPLLKKAREHSLGFLVTSFEGVSFPVK